MRMVWKNLHKVWRSRRRVEYREVQRIHLNPTETKYGCQIPKGAWHTVEVIEPSVIFEAKDGALLVKR